MLILCYIILEYNNQSIFYNMSQKENAVPSKQGVFYQLNLSKNNGPFLSKDIMYSNHKSNNLLTNHGILNQHKMMAETLNKLEKTVKIQSSNQSTTENFNSNLEYCNNQLKNCREVLRELDREQGRFKKDIEVLYDKISLMNNQLLDSTMPVLKNFMKKVKQTNQRQKAEYYKISKELNQIEMDKRNMQHVITRCKNRIQKLENTFGIRNVEYDNTATSSPKSSAFITRTNNFFD